MGASPGPQRAAPAGRRPWSSRIAHGFDDVGDAAWEALGPDMFFLSARWLRSSGSTLSPDSGFVMVGADGCPPVAALASYLIRAPTYVMLDPPRLVVAEYLQHDLAPFLGGPERQRLAILARRLRPGLDERYPVAVCVTPYGFTSGVAGDTEPQGVAPLLVSEFRELARGWGARSSSFLFISEETQPVLAGALREAGYSSVTLGAHCTLPITAGSFEEYVSSLASQRRVRRELRKFEHSGLSADVVAGERISGILRELAPLYARHVGKYGGVPDPESSVAELCWIEQRFADVSRVSIVRDGARIVSFCWLFEDRSTLYRYISGQTYDQRVRESGAYFFASFHGPAHLAIERGIDHIEAGTESYEAKTRRGYQLRRVLGFFDFGADLRGDLDEFLGLMDQAQRARFDTYAPR